MSCRCEPPLSCGGTVSRCLGGWVWPLCVCVDMHNTMTIHGSTHSVRGVYRIEDSRSSEYPEPSVPMPWWSKISHLDNQDPSLSSPWTRRRLFARQAAKLPQPTEM